MVVRATPTAVQVQGSAIWYHLKHCTRVPRQALLRGQRENEGTSEATSGEADEERTSNSGGEGPSRVLPGERGREPEREPRDTEQEEGTLKKGRTG